MIILEATNFLQIRPDFICCLEISNTDVSCLRSNNARVYTQNGINKPGLSEL